MLVRVRRAAAVVVVVVVGVWSTQALTKALGQ
jgi:hypothetical protein